MFNKLALTSLFAVVAAWGCKGQPVSSDSHAVNTATTAVESAGAHAGCDHGEKAGGCECAEGAGPVAAGGVRVEKNEAGETISHVGKELSQAAPVTIAEVVAKGAELQGKRVQLKGNVAAMCHHKRSWFALVGDDTSGSYVRVLAAPNFLVPEGSIGQTARTEGTIDVVEISATTAKHFAESHKLAPPAGSGDTVQQVVLRAVGAEFN